MTTRLFLRALTFPFAIVGLCAVLALGAAALLVGGLLMTPWWALRSPEEKAAAAAAKLVSQPGGQVRPFKKI